jgi:hypothetical protein
MNPVCLRAIGPHKQYWKTLNPKMLALLEDTSSLIRISLFGLSMLILMIINI